jgi:hypothetical protein
MSKPAWFVLGGAIVVALVVLAALVLPGGTARPSPTPGGSGGLEPAATATAPPSADPSSPATGAAASASAAARPATAAPRTSAKPALAYAAFVKRVNDDRATVERLNQDLSAAVQAQDLAATRKASVAVLDFADGEHDWLRENPPADCYATAHAAAGSMVDAYGKAANGFIKWADTGGGLAGLVVLGDAVQAAQDAADSLTAFSDALDATVCPS